jgi:hypothetical protein
VSAQSGDVAVSQDIEVKAGILNEAEVVLNAGVVDLSAMLTFGGAPIEHPAWHIYEGDADALGNRKEIASGDKSKQSFTLSAGHYRVTMQSGSAIATQDINIKAGQVNEEKVVLGK